MITFSNCQRIEIKKLGHDVEKFRTRQKDYPDDELFLTDDEKYIILCHTISEGSMNAYYAQIVVFENNEEQVILLNMNKSWTPLWTKNFQYLPKSEEIIYSLTCYDSETKKNPIPTLVINLKSKKRTMLPKELEYAELEDSKKEKMRWKDIIEDQDYCKEYKEEYAL